MLIKLRNGGKSVDNDGWFKNTVKILSCGAGQQSTALALMSCDNTIHPGKFPLVPIYDAVLFCDLGA